MTQSAATDGYHRTTDQAALVDIDDDLDLEMHAYAGWIVITAGDNCIAHYGLAQGDQAAALVAQIRSNPTILPILMSSSCVHTTTEIAAMRQIYDGFIAPRIAHDGSTWIVIAEGPTRRCLSHCHMLFDARDLVDMFLQSPDKMAQAHKRACDRPCDHDGPVLAALVCRAEWMPPAGLTSGDDPDLIMPSEGGSQIQEIESMCNGVGINLEIDPLG